jgi:3-keto steroid reductase
LAKRLRETTPKLDAVICNAGIGGWVDLYWGRAVWTILTNWKSAVTWPTFKKSGRGWVTKPQIPRNQHGKKKVEEPPLGEVFAANFFGHYMLSHYLSPLLANHRVEEGTKGRIIWVSSLEGYTHSVDMNDIQGIASEEPYESSKRLTDLVGLASTLPSTQPIVDEYLDVEDSETTTKPRIYVAHPGICGTTIFALSYYLDYAMFLVFYMARWFGSQWHPVTAYKGATAMVWLALANQSLIDSMEAREGVGKWGSATDWWGSERVERTEVEGWGWGGRLGEWTKRKGRSPYAKDLTKDDKEAFEQTGKACWEELERLRVEWEKRLRDGGVAVDVD